MSKQQSIASVAKSSWGERVRLKRTPRLFTSFPQWIKPTIGLRRFKLADTLTNYGWPSGFVAMNADDYRDPWGKAQVAALRIMLPAYFAVRVSPGARFSYD